MTAGSLPERLARADLAALCDPALPLHLLAEPDAAWWIEARRTFALWVLQQVHANMNYLPLVHPQMVAAANACAARWRKAPAPPDEEPCFTAVSTIVYDINTALINHLIFRLGRSADDLSPYHFDLARAWRALYPWKNPPFRDVDRAIQALAPYMPEP